MEVEVIFKIAAIGILTAVCCQLLKKAEREELATLTGLAALVIVLTLVVDMVGGLFETLKTLFSLY